MKEEVALFGKTLSLVGIITDAPESERGRHPPAILLLNSGLIPRFGPQRLYVRMARMWAKMGSVVLRFDFSGIGDSEPSRANLPFEARATSETQEGMDYISATRGIERFILVGICSGADISFRTACRDPRVVGAVVIEHNPRPTVRYLKSRLFNIKNWWKVLKGERDLRNTIPRYRRFIKGTLTAKKKPKGQTPPGKGDMVSDIRMLAERGADLLFVYAKDKRAFFTFSEYADKLQPLIAADKLRVEIIEGAGHTFKPISTQEQLLKAIESWLYEKALKI